LVAWTGPAHHASLGRVARNGGLGGSKMGGLAMCGNVAMSLLFNEPKIAKMKNAKNTKIYKKQKCKIIKNMCFLKPLKAQSRGKTFETIMKRDMQKMVHFENKTILFIDKIHLEKSQKNINLQNGDQT
jgi:hypothetical protein